MTFSHTIPFDNEDFLLVIAGSAVRFERGEVQFGIEDGALTVTDCAIWFERHPKAWKIVRRLSEERASPWFEALNILCDEAGKAFMERAQDAWDEYRHDFVRDAA